MRYTQLFIPTVKEVPAEAEIISHQLMIRAGMVRKVASGTYTYLPLGWRSLKKIIAIVRAEMDAAGAQEVLLPILQPMELWQKTGRSADYGPTMCRFEDRHGRMNVLAPTAEEVVTSLVAGEVSSYKQLPLHLYQVHDKFRDEFRPRFGALRSREFLMEDGYSFDASLAGLEKSYQAMYDAYRRVFDRCGLKYVVVEAESGPIGGSASQEFMVVCQAGEDIVVHTEDFSYAANIEKAEVDAPKEGPGTGDRGTGTRDQGPGTRDRGTGIPAMEDVHTPNVGTIEAVCAFLKTRPQDMIKTLIYWRYDQGLRVKIDGLRQQISDLARQVEHERRVMEGARADVESGYQDDAFAEAADVTAHKRDMENLKWELETDGYRKVSFVVAIVRGDHAVNDAKLPHLAGHHLEMASEDMIAWFTGADTGFAGPMGKHEKLRPAVIIGPSGKPLTPNVEGHMFVDHSVAAMAVGVTGANKTDYHTRNVVPGRDFPLSGENVIVADIRNAVEGDTHGGKPLKFSHGIEVGHVFKLGTKYSQVLGAKFLDEGGKEQPCIMGTYGIGINRILAAAIEMDGGHDANGCVLPVAIAPFEVEVLPLNADKPAVVAEAQRIYDELRAAGADVLLDDRDARPGVKFKDSDLIGIPLRVVVGERGLKEGQVEIKRRTDAQAAKVPSASASAEVLKILGEMKNAPR